MKDLLPVGSIVLLKDATKKLMIIGILQVNQKEKKMYDYLGVPYPEGFISTDKNFLFDHEDINDVIFYGYIPILREKFFLMHWIFYIIKLKKKFFSIHIF